MIDDTTCKKLSGTSVLKLEEDELFEDEHWVVDFSVHFILRKYLAITVEKKMDDVIKVVTICTWNFLQMQIIKRKHYLLLDSIIKMDKTKSVGTLKLKDATDEALKLHRKSINWETQKESRPIE